MAAPLLGLAGYGRSGKDTFADLLVENHGWHRLAFADRLKAVLYELDPILLHQYGRAPWRLSDEVNLYGWDVAKRAPEVRGQLQRLGLAVRQHVAGQAWVLPVMAEASDLRRQGVPTVITDVRFDNEVDAIRLAGGKVVLKRRPGCSPVNGHLSEQLAGRHGAFFDLTVEVERLDELPAKAAEVDRRLRS